MTGIKSRILCFLVRLVLFFYHPVLRVIGRENLPKEGSYLICPNHCGMADPFWAVVSMKAGFIPRIMAKKELMEIPVLGGLLRWVGVFGVDRGNADINAIKQGIRCLREGEPLLLFPEGTRVKQGQRVQAKGGAVMLAHRTGCPIVPVYLTTRRRPFSAMTCVFGEAYVPDLGEGRPTEAALNRAAEELMDKIYGSLFPHFRSKYAHIGLDEAFGLGNYQTKKACEVDGIDNVFVKYLNKLNTLVNEKYGKEIQFWDDMIISHPESFDKFPKNATAVEWGYGIISTQMMEERCRVLKERASASILPPVRLNVNASPPVWTPWNSTCGPLPSWVKNTVPPASFSPTGACPRTDTPNPSSTATIPARLPVSTHGT